MKNLTLSEYDTAQIISCEVVNATVQIFLDLVKHHDLDILTKNMLEEQIRQLEDIEWLSNYYEFSE